VTANGGAKHERE